jgi:hypothetical protein
VTADWTDDERTLDVLDDAAVMFLAVTGRHGPHVTPIAFDRDGDELWALMPRESLKTRAIRRDQRVGVLVRHRGRTVIAGGTAELVDPLTGRGLGALLRPDLPFTALGYMSRNRRRVVGAVRDDPSPGLPLSRTAVRIRLDRVARVGRTQVHGWGRWPAPSTLLTGDLTPAPPDLTGVPEPLRALLAIPEPGAVLGWHTSAGPVALPASWDPAGSIAVPAAALTLTGALSAGPACLTVERSRNRISSVRGLLLSGPGRARVVGDLATVSLDAERVTWWSGEDAGTVTRPGSHNTSGRTA